MQRLKVVVRVVGGVTWTVVEAMDGNFRPTGQAVPRLLASARPPSRRLTMPASPSVPRGNKRHDLERAKVYQVCHLLRRLGRAPDAHALPSSRGSYRPICNMQNSRSIMVGCVRGCNVTGIER